MSNIEQLELESHRDDIIADVQKLVEKYRAIFEWDVPDIDQVAADRLILEEIRRALDHVNQALPG